MTATPNRHQRRNSRLAETADAWRSPGTSRLVGYGSLDVPVSVWAEPGPGALVTGLIRELTNADAASAICGVSGGWQAAVTGRRVTVFGDHQLTREAHHAAAEALAGIQFVTSDNLANHLAITPGQYQLIVAGWHTSRGEGFWTAARRALTPGGYLAIITSASNPKTHATIAQRAGVTGFVYLHHIIVTTPTALSRAVDSETVSLTPGVKLRHVRGHRDVYVYRFPGAAR